MTAEKRKLFVSFLSLCTCEKQWCRGKGGFACDKQYPWLTGHALRKGWYDWYMTLAGVVLLRQELSL